MKFDIYTGRLGREKYLKTLDSNLLPTTKNLICIETGEEEFDNEVYEVRQCLIDYSHNNIEYSVFVEPYNWEG